MRKKEQGSERLMRAPELFKDITRDSLKCTLQKPCIWGLLHSSRPALEALSSSLCATIATRLIDIFQNHTEKNALLQVTFSDSHLRVHMSEFVRYLKFFDSLKLFAFNYRIIEQSNKTLLISILLQFYVSYSPVHYLHVIITS